MPICIAAADQQWILAFWLLLIALATDFFDGMAAIRFDAVTVLGSHFDRVADFLLAFLGLLGFILGTAFVSVWWMVPILILALFVGYVKFFVSPRKHLYKLTTSCSVLLLFGAWLFTALAYASQAYGWSWWYLLVTGIVLLYAASLKPHRLDAWFGWLSR